jgi:hypothetical protein
MTPFNNQREKYINTPNYVTPFNNQGDNPQPKNRAKLSDLNSEDLKTGEIYSKIASAASVHSQNPQPTQKSERVMIAQQAQGTNGNQNSEVKPMPPKLEERSQERDLKAADPRRLFEDEEFGDVFFRDKRCLFHHK